MCSRAMSSTAGFRNKVSRRTVIDAVSEGRQIFETTACINCHTVSGTVANGRFGPDLTHLMSRDTIASGAAHEYARKSAAVDSKSGRHQTRVQDAGDGIERSGRGRGDRVPGDTSVTAWRSMPDVD